MQGKMGLGALLALLAWLLVAPFGPAADEEPRFIVDPQAPPGEDGDGDEFFRTLAAVFDPQGKPHAQAHDLILLKAGNYHGTLSIDVPGVTLRSERGSTLTQLEGSLAIMAKQVTLEGLTIQADGQPHGLVVRAAQFRAQDVQVRGASDSGIWLEEAPQARLQGCQVSHNAGAGLLARSSADLQVSRSRFQSNGLAGLVLQDLERFELTENLFSLNGDSGARLEGASAGRLADDRFIGNAGDGLYARDSADNALENSTFEGNGGFGLVLEDSSRHQIAHNQVADNGGRAARSGGVLLRGASADNVLSDNEIHGHSDEGAAGIALQGAASANTLRDNVLSDNAVGVLLSAGENRRPRSNFVQRNRVENSQGAGILSSGQRNLFEDNALSANNGPGLRLEGATGEVIRSNTLRGNGGAGVSLREVAGLRVEGNEIVANAAGVEAEGLSNGDFADNRIHDNHGPGLRVLGGSGLRLSQNLLSANRNDGFSLKDVRQVTLTANRLRANQGVGIRLEGVSQASLDHNRLQANRGGLLVQGGGPLTVQFNDFQRDEDYGLWARSATDLDARFNFWGGPDGPGGVSPARRSDNDLVKGVALEAVFPWLPRPAEQVVARSVAGWFFEHAPGSAPRRAPQLGLLLQGERLDARRGWLTVLSLSAPEVPAPPVRSLRQFWTFVGGQLQGEVGLTLDVDPAQLPAGASLAGAQLYRQQGSGWAAVPTTLVGGRLHAWLDVADLAGARWALSWTAPPPAPAREPFIVDPTADPAEDADGDFRFRTVEAALGQAPNPQPGETLTLLPGRYSGSWTLDVPRVHLSGQGEVLLRGQLTVVAAGVMVEGVTVVGQGEVAVRVLGNGVRLRGVTLSGGSRATLWVEGRGFQLSDSRVEASAAGLVLGGENARIIGSAIRGTPAVKAAGVRVLAQRNWWGSAGGPGKQVQGLLQEDLFPWLLSPRQVASGDVSVVGTSWNSHSVWESFSRLGQALLALDLQGLWPEVRQLFGQGGVSRALGDGWSLGVFTPRAGRWVVTQQAQELERWMPATTRLWGLWTQPARGTRWGLVFAGPGRPAVWRLEGGGWTRLQAQRLGSNRWLVQLPRPPRGDNVPLWLAVAGP